MKIREGDFVETSDGLFFDVKGLVHPIGRVVAFIRYFPDEKGERKKEGTTYGKVYSFLERYELLKSKFPQYIAYDAVFDETLCEVPEHDIKKHYDPIERFSQLRALKTLDTLEESAVQFVEKLKETSNSSWGAFGISGSILVSLHNARSDLDPIVYGSDNCRRVCAELQELLNKSDLGFKPYNLSELKGLFGFRSKGSAGSFEDFVRTESRKTLQGKFNGIDYFIRFVKDWGELSERYGDIKYKNAGYARIEAEIADSSESIFTPCTYKTKNAKNIDGNKVKGISEIVSFRGRFCDQARVGESVIAQGKVEQVLDNRTNEQHFRLLLGNRPSDYMILK